MKPWKHPLTSRSERNFIDHHIFDLGFSTAMVNGRKPRLGFRIARTYGHMRCDHDRNKIYVTVYQKPHRGEWL